MGTPTRLNLTQITSRTPSPDGKQPEFKDFSEEFSNIHKRISLLDGTIDYNLSFQYDASGNISKEIIHNLEGVVVRETSFVYRADGNVDTETIIRDGKSITRTYLYDEVGSITGVQQRVAITV